MFHKRNSRTVLSLLLKEFYYRKRYIKVYCSWDYNIDKQSLSWERILPLCVSIAHGLIISFILVCIKRQSWNINICLETEVVIKALCTCLGNNNCICGIHSILLVVTSNKMYQKECRVPPPKKSKSIQSKTFPFFVFVVLERYTLNLHRFPMFCF